ncbi:aldehyde dehydrogenase [Hydrogenophaga sp.]|uniref:aldehyde dehydrogenase n=1 Tax=Hydrogenophaga sp. TaxID=1904254 RepID=UPI003F70711C
MSDAVQRAVHAVDQATAAHLTWAKTGPAQRRELLNAAAALLDERGPAFARLMVEETGTSAAWAEFNIRGGVAALKEVAALTTQIGGETIPSDQPGCIAMTVRTPVGVVLGIAPWNAPLLLGLRAVAMPLACGNAVVLKASEACPRTHQAIGELLRDAGFPRDAVQVVTHEPADAAAVVEALIAHDAVRRVNFTGSTKVGRIIGALAGKYLKPALLELGGKAPLIVLDDADIEHAVNAAAFGSFLNQGQICMSTERIIVDEKIADTFAAALVKKVAGLRETPALAGGLINEAAGKQVEALVADAQAQGATSLVRLELRGTCLRPVVLDRVHPGMKVYTEESFGPIASIVRVHGVDEAVRVANDTEYGLAGAVFGRDISRCLDVVMRLDCGVCHINGATVKSEPQLPFGGVKASGYGRFGGKAAIAEFTELKSITIQVTPQAFPF